MTLVEIMVALGLIAVSLMLVLAMIPAGIHSSQRAEDVQSATAWSRQLLEDAPAPTAFPIPADLATQEFTTQIGRTHFRAIRRIATIPGESFTYRVEVETHWDEEAQPVKLSLLKYNAEGPEPL